MRRFKVLMVAMAVGAAAPISAFGQDNQTAPPAPPGAAEPASTDAALYTDAELQELVAPIALYPDTLLIQVLVASTFPIQVVKADAFLDANAGADAATLEPKIQEQGWDESVEVLTTAFPTVINDMSDNIEWTESLGDAMLAQSDDVMDSVQAMRQQAEDAGNLESNDYQTVEVTQEGDAGDTIIIQPAQPETVYVPQYQTETVYVQDTSSNNTGDAIAAGLIAFTTFVVLDQIFDNNDPWYGYWGCRNCGGWGGRPIVNNPRNVNINGDVNIGNNVGWKPDDRRKRDAQRKIADRPNNPRRDGARVGAQANRGDAMRQNLTKRTGAADISRDRGAANRVASQVDRSKLDRPQVNRPNGLSQAQRNQVANRTKVNRPSGGAAQRPAAKKPAAKKPVAKKPPQRKASSNRGAAMQKRAPANRAHAGSNRGRAAAGGRGGGGRAGGGRR